MGIFNRHLLGGEIEDFSHSCTSNCLSDLYHTGHSVEKNLSFGEVCLLSVVGVYSLLRCRFYPLSTDTPFGLTLIGSLLLLLWTVCLEMFHRTAQLAAATYTRSTITITITGTV